MPLLLIALLLLLSSCASPSELSAARERIAALEKEVASLIETTGRLKATPSALAPTPAQPAGPTLQLDTPFTATCPGGWRELGAIGNSKWSCRSTQEDGAGSWPQCHVVTLGYNGDWQPREFFEFALSLAPHLRTIHKPEIGPIVVETHPGFVATYEQKPLSAAQRTLAALLVEGDTAYVTSCWTTAALFRDLEPTFRRVIESVRFGKRN